jgi:hypothetical protein
MDLTPHISNGLDPLPDNRRNSPYCSTYLNAHPLGDMRGSMPLLGVTWPFTTISQPTGIHPFPQILREGEVVLELIEQNIRIGTPVIGATPAWTLGSALATYDANSTGSAKGITSGGGMWHMAAVRNMWFATNGQSLVYSIASNPSAKVLNAEAAEGFTVETVCIGKDGSLLMGGLAGSWFSDANWTDIFTLWRQHSPARNSLTIDDTTTFGNNCILAGPPGGGADDVPYAVMMAMLGLPSSTVYTTKWRSIVRTMIEDGRIMLHPLSTKGKVRRILKYGEGFMVYTDDAIYRLTRKADGGFDEVMVLDFGVCGRGAVFGDDENQAWLSKQGRAYKTVLGQGVTDLMGESFLSTLSLNDAVVCAYDSMRKWFWFTDADDGFCVTDSNKWSRTVAIRPISLLRFSEDQLIGSFGSASGAVTIETNPFDGGPAMLRKAWGVGDVVAGCKDGGSDVWQCALKGKLELNDALTTFAAANFDRRGRKNWNIGGVEFAVQVTAADYSTTELSHLSVEILEGKFSHRPWLDA